MEFWETEPPHDDSPKDVSAAGLPEASVGATAKGRP